MLRLWVITQFSISADVSFNDALSDLVFKLTGLDLEKPVGTALSLPEFKKAQVKLANIYDLQSLSVKWYCNHGRGSEGLLKGTESKKS